MTSPPGSKQLVLWGPTVSSSKPRLFEVLVRVVRYHRLRKDFKRVVPQRLFEASFLSARTAIPVEFRDRTLFKGELRKSGSQM